MEGPPQAHDALMDQGLLHEWHPGMFVVFISHQWIGAGHPDPSGSQTAVLRGAFSSFIDGSLQVEPDLISMDISSIWTTLVAFSEAYVLERRCAVLTRTSEGSERGTNRALCVHACHRSGKRNSCYIGRELRPKMATAQARGLHEWV
ncbi:unnamed protein product [Symbiodinium necroappetens]|uniref:Uncharacterized protein n=1 Tax=Symbiodinium necroappetens TaxID=1628268 RepID=A0A812IUS6_9DINO|nr:unnamed protein product [Symbiodinium necroappetens]